MELVESPLVGTIHWVAATGSIVDANEPVAVVESMKMEHPVRTQHRVAIIAAHVEPGQAVQLGDTIVEVEPSSEAVAGTRAIGADDPRQDLAEVVDRHRRGLDQARPDAVRRRHDGGRRTARENIDDLVDADSFIEFGPLAIAAQRRRSSVDDLIERTPADGLVGGLATVNADRFGPDHTECVVATYDYTVLAGTQGMTNHLKKDRLFELAARRRLPVVMFTEGGGGRPGDVDTSGVSWLDVPAFALFGGLAGTVPLIGVNAGYCFAGNAALLGTCDVIIATQGSNIGMAGPAMIEGGGLGRFEATDIGPTEDHVANGFVDIVASDEAEATEVARRLLGFTQGVEPTWTSRPPSSLRDVVPPERKRVYDMRDVIAGLVDVDSELELRPFWNPGMITVLARIEGRPLGIIANNPMHLSGAIDHGAATKSHEFMELCNNWNVPLLFLCDTPGFMVGPESDAEGLPGSAGQLFRTGANLNVPYGTVVTRKCYGLGAQAMMGGGLKQPLFTVSWPTGEFGPMGLEGAVRLGFAREIADAGDAADTMYAELVDRMYEHGKALNVASHFEIDDVVDPADTRRWVARLLR